MFRRLIYRSLMAVGLSIMLSTTSVLAESPLTSSETSAPISELTDVSENQPTTIKTMPDEIASNPVISDNITPEINTSEDIESDEINAIESLATDIIPTATELHTENISEAPVENTSDTETIIEPASTAAPSEAHIEAASVENRPNAENDGSTTVLDAALEEAAVSVFSSESAISTDVETPSSEPTLTPSITLEVSQFTIGIGEQRTIKATLQPTSADATLTYLSSDPQIATVSASGVITGKRTGSARITISAENGIQTTATISVCKKPTSIKLSAKKLSLGVGQSQMLTFSLGKDQAGAVSFSSNRSNVATVDYSGQITARGIGTAKITAKTYNGKKATCTVTVKPAPSGVKLSHASAVLGCGQTLDLTARMTNDGFGNVTFTTDNASIATVDDSGHVVAVNPGKANITAKTYNGHTDSCAIEVKSAPTALSLSLSNLTLGVGEKCASLSVQLGDGSLTGGYTIQSSNAKIAKIDSSGAIVAVRKGTAAVTVKSYNGLTATVAVTVLAKPSRIALDQKAVTLSLNDSAKLTASYGKNQYGSYIFSSSNTSVATVDNSGNIVGVGVGKATVTVKSYNGKKATCTVTVKPEPNGVNISQASAVLGVGQTFTLSGKTTNDSIGGFSFASSNSAVAKVNASGQVTAVSCGTAVITVQTYNGFTDSCSIEVRPAPTEMTISQTKLTLGVGEKSAPLSVQLGDGSLTDSYTLQSSKANVAKIGVNGTIVGVKKGTAVITVKSYNGLATTIPVTVLSKPSRVTLRSKTLTLDAGETADLGVTFRSGQGGSYTVSSSNPNVASVDDSGKVIAVSPGSSTITVKTYNGKSASCTVCVLEPIADFGLTNAVTLGLGENVAFPICATTANGSSYQGKVSVSLSPSGIVKYSNGRLLASSLGTTTLTVTAGQLKHTCQITVRNYRDVHPLSAVAHRGGGGNWPENTLEAFSNAESTGADAVEFDVHTTADGVQVIFHDSIVTDDDGNQHAITDYTIAELREIKPDICTLDEALLVISNTNLKVMLEMKSSANGAACIEAIRRYHLEDRVMYISFYLDRLNEVRSMDHSADLGYIFSKTPKAVLQTASKLNLTALLPKSTILTQKLLSSYHAAGLKVGTWTLNDSAEIQKFRNMNIDFITSDYPDRVVSAK
ncbi:MAG: Ig-like domain-containing protein [Clostridia bacterium]|nr:Ig-like domain-containing protein [Clostridia bacterium]